MQLARRIRAFRKLKGYTQQQLAESLSISLSVYGEMERGNRQMDEQLLREIAAELRIGLEDLRNA
jgi:transcriptional regulator with XRE-family HTH domain